MEKRLAPLERGATDCPRVRLRSAQLDAIEKTAAPRPQGDFGNGHLLSEWGVKLNRVMFSSASEHWETPKDVYDKLDAEFEFSYDPCPLQGEGGLSASWAGTRVFCNPPYNREIPKWLAKAREADLTVYLLPARTDTCWWHDYVMQADEIRFLRGRLKFGGAKYNAPFPSCVVIFRGAK